MATVARIQECSVEVESFNFHHEVLFGMIDRLSEAVACGKDATVLGGSLSNLVCFATYHFVAEERLLEFYGHPNVAEHRAEHLGMVDEILAIQKQIAAGNPALTARIGTTLSNLFSTHIAGTDKRYGSFLTAQGVC